MLHHGGQGEQVLPGGVVGVHGGYRTRPEGGAEVAIRPSRRGRSLAVRVGHRPTAAWKIAAIRTGDGAGDTTFPVADDSAVQGVPQGLAAWHAWQLRSGIADLLDQAECADAKAEPEGAVQTNLTARTAT